jgi:hypothetical protein
VHGQGTVSIGIFYTRDGDRPRLGNREETMNRHAVSENPKTGEVVVDFVTWPADESFVEFNVFKYGRREGGGLVAQQYALRDYKDPRGFMKGLKPVRTRLVSLMMEGGLRVSGSAQ